MARDRWLTMRISQAEYLRLKLAAEARGASVADVLRVALLPLLTPPDRASDRGAE